MEERDVTGSMGPFLESYVNQSKRYEIQKRAYLPEAMNVLELFSQKDASSLSLFEIASDLFINNAEARTLSRELEKKKIVKIKKIPEGDYFVELTRLGKQIIKD